MATDMQTLVEETRAPRLRVHDLAPAIYTAGSEIGPDPVPPHRDFWLIGCLGSALAAEAVLVGVQFLAGRPSESPGSGLADMQDQVSPICPTPANDFAAS